MSALWSVFGASGAQAVAWALVHFLWQGALVGLALAAVLALGRGWSARLRYAVSAGALLAMLILPLATAASRFASAGAEKGAGASLTAPLAAPVAERGLVGSALSADAANVQRARLEPGVEIYLPAVFSAWALGVLLLSVYHLGGWFQVRRLTRRDARPAAAAWMARLGVLRERLGVGRPVELLESARVAVPAVVGWLKPVILVPASAFAGLAPQQLEAVLAHELAHVKRHDYLINLLQTVVETLLFYHPAVWWASRQVRIERESCCDDLALAVCGDRIGYARALATLESLRAPAPRLAMAVTGGTGSLLARIRRIVGSPAPAAERSSAWLTGTVAVLTLFACLAVQQRPMVAQAAQAAPAAAHQAVPPPPPAPMAPVAPIAPTPPAPKLSGVTTTQGTWKAERKRDGVQLEMEVHQNDSHGHHNMEESNLYPEKELIGLGAGPAVSFEIRRAAGTFHYEGRFEGAQGSGTFNFQGNPAYIREMTSLGYDVKGENLMQLALFDVSPSFVKELGNLGYKVPLDRLIQFRIHGVSAEFIRGLNDVGYRDVPAERLVQFRIHGVKPELIRSFKELGLGTPDPEDLVRLQIHGVSPDFIRAMAAAGYHGLSAEDLVRFRIHGVTPEYVRDLAGAGYPNVDPENLVRFRIHGVDASFIHEQEKNGHKGLSAEELVRLRIHAHS